MTQQLKGAEETNYGDTRISQELWQDLSNAGFGSSIRVVFKKLRKQGYSSLVVRAAMLDELGNCLAECTIMDGIESRRAQKEGEGKGLHTGETTKEGK